MVERILRRVRLFTGTFGLRGVITPLLTSVARVGG